MNKDGDRFKLEIKKFTSCLFLIVTLLNISCKETRPKRESTGEKLIQLSNLWLPYFDCYREGSIDLPYGVGRYSGRNCLYDVVSSGFIFNADTKEEVGMEIKAADKIKLYCRTKSDENALDGGGVWYKSAIINPPPSGLWVEFLYDHGNRVNIELATNGVPLRSKPLTNYESNQTLYCFISTRITQTGPKFQKLIVR